MIHRRNLLVAAGCGLAAPFIGSGPARAAEVTLRLQHAWPATSAQAAAFLAPWSVAVTEASGGLIAIEMLTAVQAEGGPSLHDQVKAGAIDIAAFPIASVPGRFPRLEVLELPFVTGRSALVNARAAQAFAEGPGAADLADLQPLAVWADDCGVFHAGKPVSGLAALKDMRLAAPTRFANRTLQTLGAIPVSLPERLVAEALAQKVIDGSMAAWHAALLVPNDPRARFHTEIPGSPRFCAAVSLLVMNRQRFAALPVNIGKVLAAKSGRSAAEMAGRAIDDRDAAARKLAAASPGGGIIALGQAEKARWLDAALPVVAAWLEQAKRDGLDGDAMLAEARALVAPYDQPLKPSVAPPAPPSSAAPSPATGAAPSPAPPQPAP